MRTYNQPCIASNWSLGVCGSAPAPVGIFWSTFLQNERLPRQLFGREQDFTIMSFMQSFATLVFLVGYVLAGSRHWQPQALANVQKRSFSNPLDRRYYYINVAEKSTGRLTWPGKTVRYCYENEDTKSRLHSQLMEAHERWVTAGLSSKFKLVPAKPEECQEKPYDVLHIKYSGETGGISTFVGFPGPDNSIRDGEDGKVPSMVLSDTTTKGMLDPVSNYAHELGHAWGLFHEHQNPAFWGGLPDHETGSVFGPGNNNWNCQNLDDYARVQAKLNELTTMHEMEDLCQSRQLAAFYNFTAYDYLPYPKSYGISHSSGGRTSDVDWTSIMIYPSGSGGIMDATIPGSDQRRPILMRPDTDTRIPINGFPTGQDVAGIKKLYGGSSKSSTLKLLQKAGGSTTPMFNRIFSKDKGSSSCL
ncbi:hypothetical protein V495_01789 [Pseudogymnoascus sp. VKM F-4514 (FW-929)]|nr:hypothetical protein V495_01789 [Pseudogymnoascus sp. VKM F-4514 (FW-929)]KFY57964.1 hypothetical protein V497_05141 [Pseudogymnoascus sp. VKM F-4516 (FW-969)]